MLDRIEGNGVRAIIVETASRFARDLIWAAGITSLHGARSTAVGQLSP
jgi:hypothetical protein